MKIIKRQSLETINDVCGKIQEMCHTDNMSLAYVTVTGKSKPHMHKNTEEIYFIIKGEGILTIDGEKRKVEKDDAIAIPKNKFHSIEKTSAESLELLAITNPRYNPDDVIEKNI